MADPRYSVTVSMEDETYNRLVAYAGSHNNMPLATMVRHLIRFGITFDVLQAPTSGSSKGWRLTKDAPPSSVSVSVEGAPGHEHECSGAPASVAS